MKITDRWSVLGWVLWGCVMIILIALLAVTK